MDLRTHLRRRQPVDVHQDFGVDNGYLYLRSNELPVRRIYAPALHEERPQSRDRYLLHSAAFAGWVVVAPDLRLRDHWGGIQLSECEPLEAISRMGLGIGRHGEAFAAWVSLLDDHDTDELEMEHFEDCYIGHWGSLEDYGDETLREIFGLDLDELPGIPDGLRQYVTLDVAGWTRDALLSGEIQSVEGDGGVYVFYGTC